MGHLSARVTCEEVSGEDVLQMLLGAKLAFSQHSPSGFCQPLESSRASSSAPEAPLLLQEGAMWPGISGSVAGSGAGRGRRKMQTQRKLPEGLVRAGN